MKDVKKELPKGWRWENLGDAGKLSQGGTPSTEILDYWNGSIPFITGADVTSLYVSKSRSFLTETGLNSGKTERCEKGDLLIVSRTRVGRVGIADAVLGISQDVSVIKLKKDYDAKYLAIFLKSISKHLAEACQGSTIKGLTRGYIESIQIPLPPTIEDQIAIANELERKMAEVETMRQAALRQKDASVAMQRATLRNLFKDDQTKNWQKKTLGDVIRVSSGVEISFSKKTENTAIPVYGGNGIAGYADRCLFNEPKIVIGRVGAQCGNVNYTEKYSWITDNALYVKEKKFPVKDKFLIAVLDALNLNSYANRKSQPFISGSLIYPLEISIPPTATEQLAVADILERKMSEISKLKEATHIQFEAIEAMPGAILREVFDFGKN